MPDSVDKSRAQVVAWISQERAGYADASKYKEDTPGRDLIREALEGGDWRTALDFVSNYLTRAQLFGLSTEQGKQAMGKAIVASTHILETAVEYFGDMPKPAFPSGELHEWEDCPVPVERSRP